MVKHNFDTMIDKLYGKIQNIKIKNKNKDDRGNENVEAHINIIFTSEIYVYCRQNSRLANHRLN